MGQTVGDVFYFGCWNQAGHCLFAPGGENVNHDFAICRYDKSKLHLDATLAPKRHRYSGCIVWTGMDFERYRYECDELPQGQFLRHELDNGFTAIQWWDRNQGDKRGACNSTILVRGRHTSAEMLAALAQQFPHVLANLRAAGVELVEVTPDMPAGR